ncbi:MAG: HAD hydrolase-like protein [Caulobacter sp.]
MRIVIFDCDGVLLVSNRMKIRVFGDAALAAGFHPDDIALFQRHVAANFGTSRYKLFEWLLRQDNLRLAPDTSVDRLCASYAERLYGSYLRCPSTPGMKERLTALKEKHIPLYVVSGSDQEELRKVMQKRGLYHYFDDVFGSPAKKEDHINNIISIHGIPDRERENIIFIGDAKADFDAARSTRVKFIYMHSFSTAKDLMQKLQEDFAFASIRDLRNLRLDLLPEF